MLTSTVVPENLLLGVSKWPSSPPVEIARPANRSRPRALLLVTHARDVPGKLIRARTYRPNLIDVRDAPIATTFRILSKGPRTEA